MQRYIDQAEKKLAEIFKDTPNLSEKNKESLAKAWPIIALVFGVLQILAAWALLGLTRTTERLLNQYNNIYSELGGASATLSAFDRTVIYLGIGALLVDGVILLMAYSPLKERKRRGWDLLFLAALINLIYGVLSMFIQNRGVGSLFWSIVSSVIGFYLLFQVQNKFSKASK